MTQCTKPCKDCRAVTTVLVELSESAHDVSSAINEMLDDFDFDDSSITVRIGQTDIISRCPLKKKKTDDMGYDDCLF